MGDWGSFIRANFDKILLFTLFIVLIALVVHLSHHASDADQVAWGREQSGTVLGALLGLITGAALRRGQEPEPAKPPEPQPKT